MIDHVALTVTPQDARDCASFYELLGFVPLAPPESLAGRAIWLTQGGTTIHLLHTGDDGTPNHASEAGAGHVAVVVENYDATIGALTAAGVTVEPRTEHWGSPRCYVRDPAGNLVELMAFPPPSA